MKPMSLTKYYYIFIVLPKSKNDDTLSGEQSVRVGSTHAHAIIVNIPPHCHQGVQQPRSKVSRDVSITTVSHTPGHKRHGQRHTWTESPQRHPCSPEPSHTRCVCWVSHCCVSRILIFLPGRRRNLPAELAEAGCPAPRPRPPSISSHRAWW